MFFTFEISRPIQWVPGKYRSKGMTTFRIWWLFFSVSLHPMRYDEMIELAGSGIAKWDGGLTTRAADASLICACSGAETFNTWYCEKCEDDAHR